MKAHILRKKEERQPCFKIISYRERSYLQKKYNFSLPFSMHMHILIYEYKSMAPLSLDPRFDFTTYAIQVCYIVYPYLKLHINLFRSREKQKKAKFCYALVRSYTPLSDLRVPFEEYKVNYAFLEKIYKNSKC